MLFELTIVPLGVDEHISGYLAETVEIIQSSGLPYQLTPSGTCIEGEWDKVMSVVHECHERMRGSVRHVITEVRIEDDADGNEKLTGNVASIQEKLGKPDTSRESYGDIVQESSEESFPASDPPSWTTSGL